MRLVALPMMALSLSAVHPSAVRAQFAPGNSGFSSAPTQGSENEYWWLLRELGHCLSRSKTDEARAFLSTAIDTPAEETAFDELFHAQRNVCMRNYVNLTTVRAHIRGAVAEGMYERHVPDRASFRPAAAAPNEPVQDLHDFARCYVADHAETAHAFLVDTRLGNRDEIEAVRGMAADFGPCLPQGAEVRLNPPEVRMAIAEALYHAAAGTTLNGIDE